MGNRAASIKRKTRETEVMLSLDLDGTGTSTICSGVGFLDHMLELLAKHSGFDLTIDATGDVQVDDHHTVEDVGICLGQALAQALGAKAGIRRYASASLPMQDSLVDVAIDLGGRFMLVFNVAFPSQKVGAFDAELVQEFMEALAMNAGMNLHVNSRYGGNSHHIAEAIFKGLARTLRSAVEIDPREAGVPSSKGTL